MTPKPDINAFLAGLSSTPEPEPKPRASKEPPRPPEPPSKTAAEDSGLVLRDMHVTTWQRKRIIMNEPGIENAIAQIKTLPEPEHTYHSIMGGDFHGFDMVPTIQRLAGHPLRGLHIATLGFNQRNNLQLCRMMDEGLVEGPVTIVASTYFGQADPKVFSAAKQELESRGSRLASTRNHAKIIAAETGPPDNPAFIVIETSANLRSCNALEQFSIANSEPLYRFHCRWIDEIASQNY